MGDNLALRNEGNLGMAVASWHFCICLGHDALKSQQASMETPVSILVKIAGWGCEVIVCTGISVYGEIVWMCATGGNFLMCNDLF